MAGRKRERERDGDFAGTTSSTVCRCKNSRCLKLYCECFRANSYCGDCSCKNCQNKPEFEDKRKQAIERIQERNGTAFAKGRKPCNCKRSMCLKKYCDCFQAGLVCLPECKCNTCKNFEGSETRRRVLAGEEVDMLKKRPRERHSVAHELDHDDDDDDDDEMGADAAAVGERRAPSRRQSVPARHAIPPPASGARASTATTATTTTTPATISGGRGVADYAQHALFLDTTVQRPSALPIRQPHAATRSFRDQLVRMDLTSFIGRSLPGFCHLLLVCTDRQQQQQQQQQQAAVGAGGDASGLRTDEVLRDEGLQQRRVLEETAAYLTRVLDAARSALESADIIGGAV